MADAVATFNRLRRPEYIGKIRNHWHFAIRDIPFLGKGHDVVQFVVPDSRQSLCTDPGQIPPSPTIAEQIDILVPFILKSFIGGTDSDSFAPFSWGTRSSELARAVETKLRVLGVREDLCIVQPSTKKEDEAADGAWSTEMDLMMKTLGSKLPTQASQDRVICGGCSKDSSRISGGLIKCKTCNSQPYCSDECLREDWKHHKETCGKSGTTDGQQSSSTTDQSLLPCNYYHKIAFTFPEARVLAESIKLPLPSKSERAGDDLSKPIRALVIAGKDTPQNLQLLLGPVWKSENFTWKTNRFEILLKAPVGSPSYAKHHENDAIAPVFSPRPASGEETARIEKIRDIQSALRTRLGTRKKPNGQDMLPVFKTVASDQTGWPAWIPMIPNYKLAIDTMDQGV
ncbi:hypothetical protein LSUE1_G003483 [Lachnellula suecica]|uniref:MYND-type domain-containing protein n=1 Tax=Lachnellula suecica TaxID=602035 RepID=A0A8T9C9N5_9HELO|nr:hypothetical protein LSUE1_G003483 [Lachnellula suecica]